MSTYAPDKATKDRVPDEIAEMLHQRWDGAAGTARELVEELGISRSQLIEFVMALGLENTVQPSDDIYAGVPERRCASCRHLKPLDDFAPYGTRSGRRHTTCVACEQEAKYGGPIPLRTRQRRKKVVVDPPAAPDTVSLVHLQTPYAAPSPSPSPSPYNSSSSTPCTLPQAPQPPETITKADIPPALFELLRLLPLAHQGEPWTEMERSRWLDAFTATLRVVYPLTPAPVSSH